LNDKWDQIQNALHTHYGKDRDERMRKFVPDFNAGVTQILNDLTVQANQMLAVFEQNVSIRLSLAGEGLQYKPSETRVANKIDNRIITLSVDYYGRSVARHHMFLNEARLSAIAISIYLGALLMNPSSQLRVLFLDDVLIGLDFSNRLPLLAVLERFFLDWQVILATYDKVWFDMAWQHVEGTGYWVRGELYRGKTNEGDIPVYCESKDYLKVAQDYITNNDFKAAAVYIRSAYERCLTRFCEKQCVLVRYCENPKYQESNDFWQQIKKATLKDGGAKVISPSIERDIDLYRSSILNPLSHSRTASPERVEVEGALKTVDLLQQTLRNVPKNGLT
jgi:hypothetical protein